MPLYEDQMYLPLRKRGIKGDFSIPADSDLHGQAALNKGGMAPWPSLL